MDENDVRASAAGGITDMTPAQADIIERREVNLVEDLDRRIAGAATLDTVGAALLGYDVLATGQAWHKDVRPYEDGDPRAAAWGRGQATALNEIEARNERQLRLLGALGEAAQSRAADE